MYNCNDIKISVGVFISKGLVASGIRTRFGAIGEDMWLSANGVDDSLADADNLNRAQSIGHRYVKIFWLMTEHKFYSFKMAIFNAEM